MIKALAGIMMFKLILGIVWFVLFVWAVVDILHRKKSGLWKTLWILVCLVFPILGVLFYYLFSSK